MTRAFEARSTQAGNTLVQIGHNRNERSEIFGVWRAVLSRVRFSSNTYK